MHRRSRRHGRRWANERAHGELRSLRCRYYADAPGRCQLTPRRGNPPRRATVPAARRPLVRWVGLHLLQFGPRPDSRAGQSARSGGMSTWIEAADRPSPSGPDQVASPTTSARAAETGVRSTRGRFRKPPRRGVGLRAGGQVGRLADPARAARSSPGRTIGRRSDERGDEPGADDRLRRARCGPPRRSRPAAGPAPGGDPSRPLGGSIARPRPACGERRGPSARSRSGRPGSAGSRSRWSKRRERCPGPAPIARRRRVSAGRWLAQPVERPIIGRPPPDLATVSGSISP